MFRKLFPSLYERQTDQDVPLDDVSGNPPSEKTTEKTQGEPEGWGSRASFLIASIGAAVGVGNIWRFPYLTYKYGGGAFLIPYFLSLFFLGIPLLALEFTLGQYFRNGVVKAFSSLDKRYAGIGVSGVYNSIITVLYYQAVLAWSCVYFVQSFQSPLPWKDEPAQHFADTLHLSDSISEASGLSWVVLVGLLVSWVVAYFCIFRGISAISKIVWVTVLLPYLLLVVLFFRGVTLPGAAEGIRTYLDPNWSKLGSFDVWRDAASQILYGTNPTFGVMIAYANHVDRKSKILENTVIVAGVNAGTSFFAGFVVWSVLGYMAQDQGVPIDQLQHIDGHGLAFVAFPQALSLMPAANLFSVIFFFMLFTLGIDSAFSMVEVIVALVSDTTHNRYKSWLVAAVVCAAGFAIGIIFSLDNGLYFLDIFDHYLSSFALLIVGCAEVFAVGFLYGRGRFIDEVTHDLPENSNLNNWVLRFLWTYGIALFLGGMLVWEFVHEILYPYSYGGNSAEPVYPGWALFFGWALGLAPLLIILLGWWSNRNNNDENENHDRNHHHNYPSKNVNIQNAEDVNAHEPQLEPAKLEEVSLTGFVGN